MRRVQDNETIHYKVKVGLWVATSILTFFPMGLIWKLLSSALLWDSSSWQQMLDSESSEQKGFVVFHQKRDWENAAIIHKGHLFPKQ